MIESTWESTYLDPRRNDSKENWKWVDARSEWVDSIRIFQNWVDLGVDPFGPEGVRFKKEGEWVDARSEWVDSLKFPRMESTCGPTCSDPRVLCRVMSWLTKLKPPKMSFCNVIHLFCAPFFFACNGYFRDKNERNWPIEWKWLDLIHEHDQKTRAARGENGRTEHRRLSGTHTEWKITRA